MGSVEAMMDAYAAEGTGRFPVGGTAWRQPMTAEPEVRPEPVFPGLRDGGFLQGLVVLRWRRALSCAVPEGMVRLSGGRSAPG